MNIFDFLQLVGGFILTFGFIPQIIQLLKTKSSNDLNLKSLFSVMLGIALMEVYAINLALSGAGLMFLVTNTMSLIIQTIVFTLACKYKTSKAVN